MFQAAEESPAATICFESWCLSRDNRTRYIVVMEVFVCIRARRSNLINEFFKQLSLWNHALFINYVKVDAKSAAVERILFPWLKLNSYSVSYKLKLVSVKCFLDCYTRLSSTSSELFYKNTSWFTVLIVCNLLFSLLQLYNDGESSSGKICLLFLSIHDFMCDGIKCDILL